MILPRKGFYIHYKHDPSGPLHNFMYEVVGIGRNTEDKSLTVLYRPMYKNDWMPPADLQSRPLEMFLEEVKKDGIMIPRFKLIKESRLIAELEDVKQTMYS